jgi:hypothetical protein
MFNRMRRLVSRLFRAVFSAGNQSVQHIAPVLFFSALMIFSSSFLAGAQSKKGNKLPSQGSLSTKPLDTGTKAKKFEELSDFVLVDYRAGAITGVVEPDGEESSLKRDLEEQFPVYTVFATSDPQVCVIGVESTADAKTVFSKTNPKKSRIAKRDNIGKMLAENNVKLITKEK